jgi:S-(hydroxymethyl)glutathione dehydrogenase / alcohol dehydrogenase
VTRAAVLTATDSPLEILEVDLESPREWEIKVDVAASGVCHSDLSLQNGTMAPVMPMILGHEAAGIVTEVGEKVTSVAPGDHIVMAFVTRCGDCFFCQRGQPFLCSAADMPLIAGCMPDGSTRVTHQGNPVTQMCACGSFSEQAIIPETSAVKISDDVNLRTAALIGCGVLTGVGAALNTADIAPGDTVAVVGCGGVGLNVIQGARIAGAAEIIAIDLSDKKLEMTKQFGATQTVNPNEGDPIVAVQKLTDGRGADVTFEVIGLEPTVQQSYEMTRRGGQTVLVGMPGGGVTFSTPALSIVFGSRTVKGCWYGSSDVLRDVPRLLDLHASGQLLLDELISAEIKLDEVNDAFETMKTGEAARSVIVF